MTDIPSTADEARAVLIEHGHEPSHLVHTHGVTHLDDTGQDPIELDAEWGYAEHSSEGVRLDPVGDWVRADLAAQGGPGAVVYLLSVDVYRTFQRYAQYTYPVPRAAWDGLTSLSQRVVTFRPLDRDTRRKWAVLDWSGINGIRSDDPLADLLTLIGDLDRLQALINRCRSLAASSGRADHEGRADLWAREAAQLTEFRARHQAAYVRPLAAQWLAIAPDPAPPNPRRAVRPVHLR